MVALEETEVVLVVIQMIQLGVLLLLLELLLGFQVVTVFQRQKQETVIVAEVAAVLVLLDKLQLSLLIPLSPVPMEAWVSW